MTAPIGLAVKLPFNTPEEFLQKYGLNVTRGGIYLRSKSLKAPGTAVTLDLKLSNGDRLIHASAVVASDNYDNHLAGAPLWSGTTGIVPPGPGWNANDGTIPSTHCAHTFYLDVWDRVINGFGYIHEATFHKSITLTSKYAWLYGAEASPGNSPGAGGPRHIYDEASVMLDSTVPAGSRIRLQKYADRLSACWASRLLITKT